MPRDVSVRGQAFVLYTPCGTQIPAWADIGRKQFRDAQTLPWFSEQRFVTRCNSGMNIGGSYRLLANEVVTGQLSEQANQHRLLHIHRHLKTFALR
jgi:hypothetical protein